MIWENQQPYNPARDSGLAAIDWDICSVCRRAFSLVGPDRVVRKHGPIYRRCPGSGQLGIYRSEADPVSHPDRGGA